MMLKAPSRNVLIKIQLDNKEIYIFDNGNQLVISKGFDFNRRKDSPSFAKVVDGDNIPKGAVCLIHHNASHDSFKVFGVKDDEGKTINNLFSVAEDMVYMYKEEGKDWMPYKDFLITYRIFKPYLGILTGIEPEQVKQRLYIRKGNIPNYEVDGKVLFVTPFSDYECIFHENGKETSVIRTRSREVLGIDLDLTRRVLKGEYLIGNNLQTAKIL